MSRNATKRWKLAAIFNFGAHFEFSYLTAWHSDVGPKSDQSCFLGRYPPIGTENETFDKVEMTEYLGTPLYFYIGIDDTGRTGLH